jgi:copper(I)-binding protein
MQTRKNTSIGVGAALAALLVLMLVAACSQGPAASQGISGQNVWARPAKMMAGDAAQGNAMQHGGATSAVYMTLNNPSAASDRLISAQTDVAHSVEIHETRMEGDVMRMQQVEDGIETPAGGQVELKPGGLHIMLIGLTRDLNVGDTFPVTLKFASGATLTVEAEVRQP